MHHTAIWDIIIFFILHSTKRGEVHFTHFPWSSYMTHISNLLLQSHDAFCCPVRPFKFALHFMISGHTEMELHLDKVILILQLLSNSLRFWYCQCIRTLIFICTQKYFRRPFLEPQIPVRFGEKKNHSFHSIEMVPLVDLEILTLNLWKFFI